MTDTSTVAAPVGKPSRSRRWLRLAVPVGVVVGLIAVTLTAHIIEQPDPTDPAFLSPTSRDGIGASTLADRLTRQGITIDRATTTPDALAAAAAAASGEVTLFIPAPDLVYPDYLGQLSALPPSARVVLVAPGPAPVSYTNLNVAAVGRRWAAAVPAPGCAQPWATGPAAVRRWRYAAISGGRFDCYAGGVVEVGRSGATVTFVGASDPFRNDRLDEHANAALAVGLLARSRRVVWLDLHERERPPPGPNQDPQADPQDTTPGPVSGPDEPGDPRPGNEASPSILDAFPPALWATVALLAIAAIALAAAAARRVGAPVAEPLPVRVQAAETVRGLGGLYRRARADDASLATIQAAARYRLTEHLGLPPNSSPQDIAARIPSIPGISPEQVERLLGDPDQDLATTAEAVQNLVRHVKGNVT
jgi:hypothetical protein